MRMSMVLLVCALVAGCKGGKDDTGADDTDDCAGTVDDCGVCDGGNADKDCAGVCFGPALEDACGECDAESDNDCVSDVQESGAWDCGVGDSCQDVYAVELKAGDEVEVRVNDVTGASVVRLAAFRPGSGLDGDNVLVGTTRDQMCTGQDEGVSAQFVADASGTWQIAVGRDWGTSAGVAGTYTLEVEADPGMTWGGAVEDDVLSEATGTWCGWRLERQGAWNCASGDSCQDVYDVELTGGMVLGLELNALTGASVPGLALYAPGVALGGDNLLTGSTADRVCVGQDEIDVPPLFTVPTTGTYRLAVTRDWGPSSGDIGTYALALWSADRIGAMSQTVDDVDSLAPTTQCGWTFEADLGWDCGVGVSCQDVFDVELLAGASVNVAVSEVTGFSVVRLAAFAPGVGLSGTNLMTGGSQDVRCWAQDADASANFSAATSGLYRVAVGRDWGMSAGASGTYRVTLTVEDTIPEGVAQTVEDQASEASGGTCF